MPPGLFVKNLRLNEARRRLMSGERATVVAGSVGFKDPAYFIQEFRRRYGMLPSDYQRRFGFGWIAGRAVPKRRKLAAQEFGDCLNRPNRHLRPRITSFTRGIRRQVSAEPELA